MAKNNKRNSIYLVNVIEGTMSIVGMMMITMIILDILTIVYIYIAKEKDKKSYLTANLPEVAPLRL